MTERRSSMACSRLSTCLSLSVSSYSLSLSHCITSRGDLKTLRRKLMSRDSMTLASSHLLEKTVHTTVALIDRAESSNSYLDIRSYGLFGARVKWNLGSNLFSVRAEGDNLQSKKEWSILTKIFSLSRFFLTDLPR
jgi:hypothetical protein